MAINYAKIKAKAKALIEANGRDCTFTRKGRDPADSARPWKGPTTDTGATNPPLTYANIKAVVEMIEIGDTPQDAIRTPLRATLIVCDDSFPAGHVALENLDSVNDGSITWRILYARPIAPGDTDIIYEMGLEG